MSNFVLVQGAWSWERVIERLQAARESHDVGPVLAPDLPGHGRRSGDEVRRITMEHYIQAVVTPVQVNRLKDVVLVGHGFAATFLPEVALRLGEAVRRVVFITGELPPEGNSAYERLSLRDKLMLKVFKAGEKGFRFPDFIFRRKLFDGLDGASIREYLSRLVPEPLIPWQTPVSREGFVGNFPMTWVILTKDRLIPYRLQQRYIRSLGSPEFDKLEAGHGALLSHPLEVSRILLNHV